MASYEVRVTHAAEKDLVRLPEAFVPGIWQRMKALSHEPRPKQAKKLKGAESAYRLRVRGYRVIYTIDDEHKVVRVVAVRHRREAYR